MKDISAKYIHLHTHQKKKKESKQTEQQNPKNQTIFFNQRKINFLEHPALKKNMPNTCS